MEHAPKQLAGRTTVTICLVALLGFICARYWANAKVTDSILHVDMPLDLWIYLRGGERVSNGADLYHGPIINDLPFTYPPFSGMLFSWLSMLEDTTVAMSWHSVSVLGTAYVVWASLQWLKVRMTALCALIVPLLTAVFLLGTEPLHATLFWGQVNVVLMVLVCLDFLPGKYRLPGIGVGLAAGIKLTPAFFGLLFLLQRRWMAASISFLTFLLTVVVGLLAVPDAKVFWTDAMFDSKRVGVHANPGAQSIKSVMVRVFEAESQPLWLAIVLLTVALTLWSAWWAVQRNNMPAAIGIMGIGACLVSPFSWYHHWVWIVPVTVAAFVAGNQAMVRWAGRNRVRWQVAGFMSVAVIVLMVAPYCATSVAADWLFAYDEPLPPGFQWRTVLYIGAGLLTIVGNIAHGLCWRHDLQLRRQAPGHP